MFKRNLALALAVVLVMSIVAGCAGGGNEGANAKVGMITDTGGLGDQSFNDSAYDGLQRAEEEFGVEVSVLESSTADDYGPNLTSFAEENMDLTIGVGFLFEESMKTAADQFPEKNFAIVDAVVDKPNVASLTFKEHQGSFLVGVIAAQATETNKIGFIGGQEFPLIQKFEYGFRAGVKSVNPDAEVIVNYANSFEDAAKGKEIAKAQHDLGADVIYHAAGGVGLGLMEAAEEEDFWAIGVDKDQSGLAPENVLCSMVKRVDNATFLITESIVNENFEGGKVYSYGLADDGVGVSDEAGNLPSEYKELSDKYKKAIVDGEFEVPSTPEEFDAWEVPEI